MRFSCSLFWIMFFNGPALKVLNLCMSIALRNAQFSVPSLNVDSLSSVILLDWGSQSPLSLTFYWWFLNLWMWVEKCAASNCYLCVMQPCWISQCQFLQQFWQLYSCVRSGVSVKLQASTLNRTTPIHWISGTFGTKICLQSLGIEFLVVIIPLLRFNWYIFRNSLQLSGRPLCFTTGIYISRSAQILNLHYLYPWDHLYPFLTFKPSKEQLVMPQKEPWNWWCNLWILLKIKVLKVINFAERSDRIIL